MTVTAWGVHTCTNWFHLHTTIAICYNCHNWHCIMTIWSSPSLYQNSVHISTSSFSTYTLYDPYVCTYTHMHTQTYPISARNSCSFLCPFVVHTLNLHTYIQVMIQTMTVTYITLATTRGRYVCTESCKYIHTLRYLHAVYAEWQKLSYSVQCLYSNKRSLRWH